MQDREAADPIIHEFLYPPGRPAETIVDTLPTMVEGASAPSALGYLPSRT
jgi:hypothetical protein